jgi:hypothetical protein
VSTDSFTGDSETIVSRRLLALGESGVREREWIRYADLGVTLADIPEMIRLMRDVALNASSNPAEHWAPLHAWRALAQLGTIELVEPLIELHAELGGDDYLFQDLPGAMAHVGRAALPPLSLALDRGTTTHSFEGRSPKRLRQSETPTPRCARRPRNFWWTSSGSSKGRIPR